MTFEQFDLHPGLTRAITAQGYTAPTPIQERAIPALMAGKDLMGLAQTGSGKTAAFVLPIIHRLIAGKRGAPRALIVAPTRELVNQIDEVVRHFGSANGIRSVTIFGGVSINPQIQRLRSGVDIIIACPGRLLDHVGQRTVNLSKIEMLVLDEADQMFDMGFLPAIKRVVRELPVERQSMLFSATMPDEIRSLAMSVLRNPENVDIGRQPVSTIEHAIYPVTANLKTDLLLDIFGRINPSSVIVFTRTKHGAKRLADRIDRAGLKVTSLQGNLSQNRRQEAMRGFRSGKYQVLVATDIAARGLDISNVSHVINFDMPDTVEAYTHRIGRTGRASRSGEAFTLVTSEDLSMVRAIERTMKRAIERRKVEGFRYDQRPAADSAAPAREFSRSNRSDAARSNEPRPNRERRFGEEGRRSGFNAGSGNRSRRFSHDRSRRPHHGQPRTDSRPAFDS